MTTANDSRNSTMTSEAYDLLDCFVSGLDEVIYEIAESLANSKGQIVDGIIEISQDDVKEAANRVFNAIRERAGKEIPQSVAQQIEGMHECVMEKCRIHKSGR